MSKGVTRKLNVTPLLTRRLLQHNVHERKKAMLQELFKTLLHRLMTAEIRVADLDIDTSEVAA